MNKTIFLIFCLMLIFGGAGFFFFGLGSNSVKNESIGVVPEIPVDVGQKVTTTTTTTPAVITTSTPPLEMPLKACKKTGCSSQICSDADVITDCMYREEYMCYQKAVCERQEDGKCGWTVTSDITACLLQYE